MASNKNVPPLVLFARTNEGWSPLTAKKDPTMYYVFSKNSSYPPTEFILNKGYIMTSDKDDADYVGLFSNALAAGPCFLKKRFTYDHEMKITGKQFYNCETRSGDVIKDISPAPEKCEPVDIHLLPYDEYSKSPVHISFPQKGDVNSVNPLVFAIYIKGNLQPLSGVEDKLTGIGYFVWGSMSLNPVEVILQNNYTKTNNTRTRGSVGFFLDHLSYGLGIKSNNWELDGENKIKHYDFFSCEVADSIFHTLSIVTTNRNVSTTCQKVDTYLLRYDRKAREVIKHNSGLDYYA